MIRGKFNQDTCKHSLWDYTYWGNKHPTCSRCGFEDKTRDLTEYICLRGISCKTKKGVPYKAWCENCKKRG